MDIVILIPPSEGKQSGGREPALNTLSSQTKQLLALVKQEDPAKLYGVKGKSLDVAIAANEAIARSKTLPAIERYTGVVYDAIEYPTLQHKKLFDARVRIVSALFGLVAPQDVLPDYKLKIDKLGASNLWKPVISKALEGTFVIDLLPQAHKKAVAYSDGIAVEFVLKKNGKKMPAGHQGKHIKGRFVRWLIERDITSPEDFALFTENGYRWTGEYFLKEQ